MGPAADHLPDEAAGPLSVGMLGRRDDDAYHEPFREARS